MKKHQYTKEQIEFIREIAPSCTCDEIVEKFNKKYDLNQSKKSLKGIRYRNGIKVGNRNNPTEFKKGHITWNKGLKGIALGGYEWQYKKGPESPNWKPLGSEVTKRGYVTVKVGEPNTWKRKHYLLWEKEHGKLPGNHLIIFADGDKSNFDINNLLLVSRGQHTRLHRNNLLKDDTELTRTMLNLVKVYEAIDERSK